MKKTLLKHLSLLAIVVVFSACTKDPDVVPNDEDQASFSFAISDAKDAHNKNIIEPSKLTQNIITISGIELKGSDGEYLNLLQAPVNVSLTQLRGAVKDLLSLKIPIGTYSAVRIAISGVDITYDRNNYKANLENLPEVRIADVPSFVFSNTHGVVDAFENGEIVFEMPLEFSLKNTDDAVSVRFFFDAEASSFEIPISYQSNTWLFAGFRQIPGVSIILEDGIQQIKYSPPLDISPISLSEVNYYGIHTFKDFNEKGGEINAHSSQHIFRGEEGNLIIEAENSYDNSNALIPSEISAMQNTEVRADETFDLLQIRTNLSGKGYNLQSGKKYYFSLRKTWNITTDGKTYDLTRMCEPMPVFIP